MQPRYCGAQSRKGFGWMCGWIQITQLSRAPLCPLSRGLISFSQALRWKTFSKD